VASHQRDRIKLYLINTATGTQRKFKAQSEADRNEWVQLIDRCIRSQRDSTLKRSDGDRESSDNGGAEFVVEDNAENRAAMDSVMKNQQVQGAVASAMNDGEIRGSALAAVSGGGNDMESNRKLIGALARNEAVQRGAVSVAKDEKVQKAAVSTIRKNATKDNAKRAGRLIGSAATFR